MDQLNSAQTRFRNKIPIVFSVDDQYALYLAVTIQSIVENSSEENFYELIVLEEELSESNQQLLSSVTAGKENFSIRFFNVASIMETYGKHNLYTSSYFSRATYYRLFLSDILVNYDRVIYLDSDLIIQKDPAEMFRMNLENCYLAAGHEWVCLSPHFRIYLKATLKWKGDCKNYFAAGHMVMNLKKIREDNLIEKFMKILRESQTLRAQDQDVLNLVCQGKVVFLPPEWNICWHWKEFLSSRLLEKHNAYGSPGTPPALIHYASDRKPWNSPEKELADQWWFYANQLPFKEKIQRKALEDRCRFLQNNYDRVVNSIPWKMTAPLRRLYDFLKYDLPEISKLLTGQRRGR